MSQKKKYDIAGDLPDNKHSQWKLCLFAVFALAETLLTAGLHYGWPVLLYVFKEEGIYEDLCNNNNYLLSNATHNASLVNTVENDIYNGCSEQDKRFNLLFGISNGVGQILSTVIGCMIQHLKVKTTRIIFMPIFVGGALCLAFTSKDFPWLILPGLLSLAVSGLSVLFTNVKVASHLKTGQSIYIALLCGCYDSSAVMMRVMKALYTNGISRKYSFIGLSVLYVSVNGIGTVIHSYVAIPAKAIELHKPAIKRISSYKLQHVSKDTEDRDIGLDELLEEVNLPPIKKEKQLPHYKYYEHQENEDAYTEDDEDGTDDNGHDFRNKENNTSTEQATDSTEVKLSFKKNITSTLYSMHLIFLSILVLTFMFFIGSINKRLVISLNDEQVEHFSDVIAYVMVNGIFGSFLSGFLMEWQMKIFAEHKSGRMRKLMPQVVPLLTCGTLGVLLSALSFISSPDVFYVLFVIVVLLRSFMYSVYVAFITNVFPAQFQDMLIGVGVTVSASIGLLQYALFIWMESYRNALNHVNWMLLGLGIFSFLHPLNVFIKARRGEPVCEKRNLKEI